jgi:peptidoglycan LD-endopeptidase LytH
VGLESALGRLSWSLGALCWPLMVRVMLLFLTFMAGCGGSERHTVVPHSSADAEQQTPADVATPSSPADVSPSSPPQAIASPTPQPCRYVFPIRPYSVARFGSSHHDYPATDIFAPVGTEAVAPTDGVVDYISREDLWEGQVDDPATRGGLSFALIGDDGVRYYGSHLRDITSDLTPGSRVSAGQVLGHIGNSGNARGTPSHLHFGISHPTTPEDWSVRRGEVNPYRYLNAWRAGKAITPSVSMPGAARCLAG